jgi:hypothetical protein
MAGVRERDKAAKAAVLCPAVSPPGAGGGGGETRFLEDDLDMIYCDQPDHDIPWP